MSLKKLLNQSLSGFAFQLIRKLSCWILVFSWLRWRLHSRHSRVQFQSHPAISTLKHSSHLVPNSKLTYLSTVEIKTNSIGLRWRKSCCPSKIHNSETRTIWKPGSDITGVPKGFYSCCCCLLSLLLVQSWGLDGLANYRTHNLKKSTYWLCDTFYRTIIIWKSVLLW